MRFAVPAFLLTAIFAISPLSAQQTTVTFSASPNPAVFGQSVTLTALVTPSAAIGKVTFFDGADILGISTLTSGMATFSTSLIQAGNRSLRAYYSGDPTHPAATSSTVPLKVTTVPSYSLTRTDIPVANIAPNTVTVGDFNGDGKADVVVGGYYGLQVLLGNGDGTFRTSATYTTSSGNNYWIIVTGDFNRDGKTDIAYFNNHNPVTILLGNGDGTFQSPTQYSVGQSGDWLSYAAIADFNGDGKPDLAVSGNNTPGTGTLYVLLGNGDGTFQSPVGYPLDNFPAAFTTGDFNGDGKTDIAVGCYYGQIDVLKGNGDGTFQPRTISYAETTLQDIVAVDLNGDGKLDLALAFDGGNTTGGVSTLIGNGDGTFQGLVEYLTGTSPTYLVVGDFDGDGKLDLAATAVYSVSVLLGKGNGTFLSPLNLGGNFEKFSMAVGAFDGRGQEEIVVPNQSGGISLLLGLSSPYLGPSLTQSGTITQGQTGLTYVITAQNFGFTFAGPVQLSYSLGTGLTAAIIQSPGWSCTPSGSGGACTRGDTLGPLQTYPPVTLLLTASPTAPSNVTSTATLSFPGFNGVTSSTSLTSTILQSQVINFPVIPTHFATDPPFPISVSATSGLPVSLVSSGNCSILNSVITLDGAGNCTLTATQPGNTIWGPAIPVVRTFVIAGLATSLTMTANPATSQFGKSVTLTASITPTRSGDKVTFFDGAAIVGIAPVVAGTATYTTSLLSPGKHTLKAYYGGVTSPAVSQNVNVTGLNGFVSPSQALNLNLEPQVYDVAIADFNGDGHPDLVTISYFLGNITVLLGNGDGTFQSLPPVVSSLTTSYQTASIAAADVNGDGKIDLLVTSCSVVGVFLGNGDGTFQQAATYNVTHSGARCVGRVAIADFNGDGKADLAYPGYSFAPNPIEILLGNGDGSFGAPLDLPVYGISSLLAGDFNGDGKTDLAALGLTSIGILPGNGDGTFRSPVYSPASVGSDGYSTIPGPALVSGDFNNDGKLDLAFAGLVFTGVLLGNGDATFQPERDYGTTGNSILTTQLNQHQNTDLLLSQSGQMFSLPGNGDGTFGAPVSYPTSTTAFGPIATADFNGDGKPDVVVAGYSGPLKIFLGAATPVLNISLTHTGNFATAQDLGTYTISVQNTGLVATSGPVSVAGTFPAPLVVQSIGGPGWTCFNAGLQCFRTDSIAPNATYPPITVTVSVPTGPATVLSQAAISGGNAAATSTNDVTTITPTYLAFITQPVSATAGTTLPPIVIQMRDPSGNIVSGSSLITLTSNPPGVNLTAKAVNGVVTFSGLVFTNTGSYTLIATSPVLQSGAVSFAITASTLPTVTIESPTTGAVLLAGATTISGWSLDNIYRTGSAIKAVTVTVDGIFQGVATYSISRPDVCAAYPGRPGCPKVGFTFPATLSAGTHTIEVDATNSSGVTGSSTISVTVQASLAGTKVGVFRNSAAFLEDSNGNGVYDPVQDRYISGFSGTGGFLAGDYPVVGDWTGDGQAKVGIYRSTTGTWFLDANNNGIFDAGDFKYQFGGVAGDIPFTGDWTGAGKTCIGIYRAVGSVWLLDLNCNGAFDNAPTDAFFPFGGVSGDVPVVGAWTGGATRVGVVRKYSPAGVPIGNPFYWVLDGGAANAGSAAANHQPGFTFAFGGLPGDVFVTGDWNNNGTSYAAVFRNGLWVLDAAPPSAPQSSHLPGLTFGYGGVPGDIPLTAKW